MLRGLFFQAWGSFTSLKSQTRVPQLKIPEDLCWRFLHPEKIHRPQPGLNPRALDLEASIVPRDHRGRLTGIFLCVIFFSSCLCLSHPWSCNLLLANSYFGVSILIRSSNNVAVDLVLFCLDGLHFIVSWVPRSCAHYNITMIIICILHFISSLFTYIYIYIYIYIYYIYSLDRFPPPP